MTVPVSVQKDIRARVEAGDSEREIARSLGVSRNTVAKYAAVENFSPKPRVVRHRSLVDPFAETIMGWLAADERLPRKQRHTIQRMWERLRDEEGFTGSYHSVMRWVQRYRLERRRPGEGFSELVWQPGLAQVDGSSQLSVEGGSESAGVE